MMKVLYEDNHIIVVAKAAKEIVQGDKTGDTPLSEIVGAYIKSRYNKPGNVFVGVAHRLDRPVSGVGVYASGGVFRAGEVVMEPFTDKLLGAWPEARIVQPHFEPVIGALIRGYQQAGIAISPTLLENLRASIQG